MVLLYFLPVIIIHCYCTKSALTQFGFCNHYVIHVNKLSFSALAKFNLPSRYDREGGKGKEEKNEEGKKVPQLGLNSRPSTLQPTASW